MTAGLKPELESEDFFSLFGKWIILGIVLSFLGGIALFATLGMQRIGDPIPIDAAPNYFMADAGPDTTR